MKKVLGASIGVLAITLMSFASPRQANFKGNDAQVIYDQTVTGLTKPKPKPTPTPTPPPQPTTIIINTIVSTIVISNPKLTATKLAELNDVMNKY